MGDSRYPSSLHLYRWLGTCLLWACLGLIFLLPLPAAARPPSLTIFLSGDLAGELEACGCPGSPTGGFSRRIPWMSQQLQTTRPALVLDAGNAFLRQTLATAPVPSLDEPRASLVADLLARAGVQALAVGPQDLQALGVTRLQGLSARSKVPYLSANLVNAAGRRPFPASITLTAGTLRIGIIGLTAPEASAQLSGLRFLPLEATLRYMTYVLRPQVNLLLVLSNLPDETLEPLRRSFPQVDLFLSNAPRAGYPLVSGRLPPLVARAHGQGRYLSRLDLWLPPGRTPLAHDPALQRSIEAVDGARASIQALRLQIVQEEGRANPARFQKESQFLRSRLTTLEGQLNPTSWAFTLREVPLSDDLPEDVAIQQLITATMLPPPGPSPRR